ncbi:UNVERIFIED_CONTAM: hypothetical protein GTU68_016774, partial [Idotea baltica]|nr:hypothetical protein [Idotea baltica]
ISVIISGGGTGGHVFPAIAIAQALHKLQPELNIRFVGAYGKLEMEKVPNAGFDIDGLWINGFLRGKVLPNLLLPFKVLFSLVKSFFLVLKHKPELGIGVGGYASGPFLKTASLMGVPVLLQEQNAFPGITNKLLAKGASKVCVAYNGLDKFFDADKLVYTGNPVREIFKDLENIDKEVACKHFGLNPEKPIVFVTGGSGGARPMNEAIVADLEEYKAKDIQLIWQCGKVYLSKHEHLNNAESGIIVLDFIDKMEYAYAISDVVVSRAGALSIAEQQVVGKAVILVPSPYVTEDHQTKNAEALVKENAAIMLKDDELKNELFATLNGLINNKEQIKELSNNMKKLASADAATVIAKEALALLTND